MKWLFLILLLFNAGLFIWGQQQPNPLPLQVTEDEGSPSQNNLLLLSEITADATPTASSTEPAKANDTEAPADSRQHEIPPEHSMVVEKEPLVAAHTSTQHPPASIPLDQMASFNDQSPVEPTTAEDGAAAPVNELPAPSPSQPPRKKTNHIEKAVYLPALNPPQSGNDGIATNFSVDLSPPSSPYRCGILEGINDELTGYRIVEQMHMRNLSAYLTKPLGDGASYWVLIPPQPTIDQAQQIVAILASQGFTDTWLVDRGDLENAISLGLFNNRRNAQQYMTRVARLGLPVELKRQQSQGITYSIHFPIDNQTAPGTAPWIELQSIYPSLKMRTARCEAN